MIVVVVEVVIVEDLVFEVVPISHETEDGR
jgi:hypothetical protein